MNSEENCTALIVPPNEIIVPPQKILSPEDARQEKIAEAIDTSQIPPLWLCGNKVLDVAFCVDYLTRYDLRCINGNFFDIDGTIADGEVESNIYEMIKPFISCGLVNKVKQLVGTLKMEAFALPPKVTYDRIHLTNGTLYTDGRFVEEKQPCFSRVNISYNTASATPDVFLSYLSGLLESEDIPTLQEWLGYLFIPCTKAQKMLMLIGNGGEGKSRLGILLKSFFGKGLATGGLQTLEISRFARASLENTYCFIDDDMKMEALPQTNTLKTIVTAEEEIEIERKNIQSYTQINTIHTLATQIKSTLKPVKYGNTHLHR